MVVPDVESSVAGRERGGDDGLPRFGVRDLRNDTAGVLSAAERYGAVLITRNGEVVAKLVPHGQQPDDRTPIERFLDRVADGIHVDTGWADEYEATKRADLAAQDDDRWG